jgi:hypothetical protein
MIRKAAAAKGVVGTLVQAGVGGAAYFAASKLAPKVQFLQGRWWATPSSLILAGHLIKRWSPESGAAVVGMGGALFAMGYYMRAPAAKGAAGYLGVPTGEAGYLGASPGSAGALMTAGATPRGSIRSYGAGGRPSAYGVRSEAGALMTG